MTSPATYEEAVAVGERCLRSAVGQLKWSREMMAAALRHADKNGMGDADKAKARTEIALAERIISYASRALSGLPVDPKERALALADHMKAVELLAGGDD